MNNKIDIEISTSDGEILSFKTKSQFSQWVEEERDFWSKICSGENIASRKNNNARPFWNKFFQDLIAQQIEPFQRVISNLKEPDCDCQNLLNSLSHDGVLFSKTGKGQKILELASDVPETAIMLLAIWHPKVKAVHDFEVRINQLQWPVYKIMHSALMDAYVERKLFERGFKGAARVEKKALQTVKTDANKMLADISEKIDGYKDKLDEANQYYDTTTRKFDKLIDAKTAVAKRIIRGKVAQLEKLKKQYTEELALQIPVTYWSDKAKGHLKSAVAWGGVFILAIIVILFNASNLFHGMLEGLKIVDAKGNEIFSFADNQLALFFAITFPAFLAVWVLRILSKNMLTNINHMHDAQSRAVMTQTFLALMSEGKATENDRILILNALFQPTNSVSDDGSPPHWFELMTERMKK